MTGAISRVEAIAALMALVLLANLRGEVVAQDWPQFLGPSRDGHYAGTNLAPTWPKEGPKVLWQNSVGQGFAGPVVSQGRLILFHRLDNEEVVECLDAQTGTNRWRFAYATGYRDDFGFDEGPRATPAIAQGKVFTHGAEGTIQSLDFETGRKLWSVSARTDFGATKGFFGFACSPIVDGSTVILNIGGANGAGIVALNAATGKLVWKATGDEGSYSSPVIADVHGRRLSVFLTRAGLAAVAVASGKVAYQHPWRARMDASVNAATPLVVGDEVFLTSSYQVGAIVLKLKPSGGLTKIWSGDDSLSSHYASVVYRDGLLYGFDGRQEQQPVFRCVEWKTGKVRWERSGLGSGTVTLSGSSLLILTERGELIQANASPAGFRETARAQILPATVRAYPALAQGLFYARSTSKLVCVDLRP